MFNRKKRKRNQKKKEKVCQPSSHHYAFLSGSPERKSSVQNTILQRPPRRSQDSCNFPLSLGARLACRRGDSNEGLFSSFKLLNVNWRLKSRKTSGGLHDLFAPAPPPLSTPPLPSAPSISPSLYSGSEGSQLTDGEYRQ